MKTNVQLIDKVNRLVPVALLFLIPLFFLPITTEFFEFNKIALVVASLLFMAILALVKTLNGAKIQVTKSHLDAPLILFSLTMLLATVFSINKQTSLYGAQSRWFPALVPFLALVTYYYVTNSFEEYSKHIKMALAAFIASGSISTLVSLLSYYKVYLPKLPFAAFSNFSLSGSTTTTALISAFVILSSLGALSQIKGMVGKTLLSAVILLNFYFLLVVASTPAWAALAVGIGAMSVIFNLGTFTSNKSFLMILASICIALTALIYIPQTRQKLVNNQFPVETTLSLRASWIISAATIQDYPLLATGPSTFQYNFTRYKPMGMNNTIFWDTRFDKPFNEILNVLGTTGLIGTVSMIFLMYSLYKQAMSARKIDDNHTETKILAVLVLAGISTWFFTYATFTVTFLVFAFAGLLVNALAHHRSDSVEIISVNFTTFSTTPTLLEDDTIDRKYVKYIVALPVLLAVMYTGYVNSKVYLAEYFMRQSVEALVKGDGIKAYNLQKLAVQNNQWRASYYITLAQTNIAIANAINNSTNPSDTDKKQAEELVKQAMTTANTAAEVVDPLNPAVWEFRAALYQGLANVAENALDWSAGAYNIAAQLDPANPRLRVQLGMVLMAKKDYLGAGNQFRQATLLKADYANAHYMFAQALLQLNDPKNAKAELQITKTLIAQDSEDYKAVEEQIASIKEPETVAGASDTKAKPTVEEITKSDVKPAQTQEPLAKPAESTGSTKPAAEN